MYLSLGCHSVFAICTNPDVTAKLKQTIIDGVMQESKNRPVQQLAQEENEILLQLINLRNKAARESTSTKKNDQT